MYSFIPRTFILNLDSLTFNEELTEFLELFLDI